MLSFITDIATSPIYHQSTDVLISEYASSGAELRAPPIARLFDRDVYMPVFAYFALFQCVGAFVRRKCWMSWSGFRQYRLRNLSVCLLHSIITGTWAFGFMLSHPTAMFSHTMHWYRYWAAQLPMLSMGYFAYDAADMLRHELSRWTIELLVHHIASLFAFACAVLSRKFVLYAYWALLMEVNSIFLHIRSMMQITGRSTHRARLYRFVRILNAITFIIFRFAVQTWQLVWAWQLRAEMHIVYAIVAIGGSIFFIAINIVLFVRVCASDGMLGECGRRHAAISRDEPKDTKNS